MNLAHHFGLLRTGVIAMLLLLGGCAGYPHAPAAALAGTSWQLESIGSPADSGQALPIADAARYTVTFGADGRASLRLDCNRGHGSYTQQAAADGVSGTLACGPLATTRALCQQPEMDARVTAALTDVRGYLLQQGKLLMTLQDGAVCRWTPLR